MPKANIQIDLIGDKELMRKLNNLEATPARKIANKALRASAKRLSAKVAAATPADTGRLKGAIGKAKIRAAGKRNFIRIGFQMPTREALGIPQDTGDKKYGYYPFALEYGTKDGRIPPKRFVRGTVDANRPAELKLIGRDIGEAIEREARK